MVAAPRGRLRLRWFLASRSARKARYDLKPLLVHVRTRCNYLVTGWADPDSSRV